MRWPVVLCIFVMVWPLYKPQRPSVSPVLKSCRSDTDFEKTFFWSAEIIRLQIVIVLSFKNLHCVSTSTSISAKRHKFRHIIDNNIFGWYWKIFHTSQSTNYKIETLLDYYQHIDRFLKLLIQQKGWFGAEFRSWFITLMITCQIFFSILTMHFFQWIATLFPHCFCIWLCINVKSSLRNERYLPRRMSPC